MRAMAIRVYIDGAVRLPEDAKVSVLDRGFLYGDSVYETIGTMYGRLFAARDHLDRLERSARRIGMRVPPRAEIEAAIAETVAAAGNAETRVRVMLTRGVGKLDLDPASCDDCRLVVIAFPLGAPTPEMFEKGVAVAIVSVTRNSPRAIDPAVKSGNYLNNVLALGEARRVSGAYEAILCADDGSVAEGSTSNVFAVVGGVVWTPPADVGILDGITRAKVMQLASGAGIAVVERRIQPDELRGADEAFLTSATRGVLPITTIDGRPVGGGVPGPVTRRLMALYDGLARRGVE
jgi:branched-chain amino acid aminotransferase